MTLLYVCKLKISHRETRTTKETHLDYGNRYGFLSFFREQLNSRDKRGIMIDQHVSRTSD